jgi:hypothetical protein
MDTETGGAAEPLAAWQAFVRRHAGLPFAASETLYALTEPIIEAVQAELPGFLRPAEEGFERDLARTASFGFFHGRVLGFTAAREARADTSLRERQGRAARAVRAMLGEEYRASGVPERAVEESAQAAAKRGAGISRRQHSFTGWLVTQPAFHREVAALRAAWGPQIARLGRFPAYPRWPLDELGREAGVPEEFRAGLLAFNRRWGLDQLLTWEWPVPMEPDLVGGLLGWDDGLAEAGLLLFVPWYLVKGQKLDLQELARQRRLTAVPPHLRGWVQAGGARRDELGDVRYERLAWLYRYLVLALQRRYPGACRRRAGRLDWALSRVVGIDAESVRKGRQELQRAARSA